VNFDSLNTYGIDDIYVYSDLFVFLKEKLSWYPELIGQFLCEYAVESEEV